MARREGRFEAAFVLLLVQGSAWVLAGLGALPFGLAGERGMLLLGTLTILLGAIALWLGVALVLRLRRARRLAIALEWLCLAGAFIQWVLPVGYALGPVALLMGLGLPATLLWLLHGKARESVREPARARYPTSNWVREPDRAPNRRAG